MILRRLALGALIVWGASLLVFVALAVIPGDPINAILRGAPATAEAIASIRAANHLDDPLWMRYAAFLGGLAHGDLGESYVQSRPVAEMLAEAIPATLALTGASLLIGVVLGGVLGLLSAIFEGHAIDHAIRGFSSLFAAMPVFWTGILLLTVFAFGLGWFPGIGGRGLDGLVLPALSLGLASAGVLTRVVRTALLEARSEPFHLMLRAKGLPEWRIIVQHSSRTALVPVLAVVGLQLGEAFAGAVVTETVFSRQGVGRLLVTAILNKDYPVVQGVMLAAAAALVLVNLITDLAQRAVDPRIRVHEGALA